MIPSAASEVYPPLGPRNFAETSVTAQLTPATPLPLPPTPPIVPDTCVPCVSDPSVELPSNTVLLLFRKSQPWMSST